MIPMDSPDDVEIDFNADGSVTFSVEGASITLSRTWIVQVTRGAEPLTDAWNDLLFEAGVRALKAELAGFDDYRQPLPA